MYNTNMTTNITTEINEYKSGNWINMINPTESEIFEEFKDDNGTYLTPVIDDEKLNSLAAIFLAKFKKLLEED